MEIKRKMDFFQSTLLSSVSCEGKGVHSGKPVRLTIHPADVDTGFLFIRTDKRNNNHIYASYQNVTDTHFCTKIQNEHGESVATVEHLLAALYGEKITNAVIEVDGPEIPIMDGSSVLFSNLFRFIRRQEKKAKVFKVNEIVKVSYKNAWAQFLPHESRNVSFYFDAHQRLAHWNIEKT